MDSNECFASCVGENIKATLCESYKFLEKKVNDLNRHVQELSHKQIGLKHSFRPKK